VGGTNSSCYACRLSFASEIILKKFRTAVRGSSKELPLFIFSGVGIHFIQRESFFYLG
jgi:hypothetical protein